MPVKLEFSDAPNRIEVTYSGTITESDYRKAIIDFVNFNSEKKCLLVLTDLRDMVVTPSILNVYDSINLFEKMGIDKKTSEALIMPENKFAADNIKFYETACQNRGYNVKIFYNKEDAINWLRSFAEKKD